MHRTLTLRTVHQPSVAESEESTEEVSICTLLQHFPTIVLLVEMIEYLYSPNSYYKKKLLSEIPQTPTSFYPGRENEVFHISSCVCAGYSYKIRCAAWGTWSIWGIRRGPFCVSVCNGSTLKSATRWRESCHKLAKYSLGCGVWTFNIFFMCGHCQLDQRLRPTVGRINEPCSKDMSNANVAFIHVFTM